MHATEGKRYGLLVLPRLLEVVIGVAVRGGLSPDADEIVVLTEDGIAQRGTRAGLVLVDEPEEGRE